MNSAFCPPKHVASDDHDPVTRDHFDTFLIPNLYNARPQWLANAHAALDEAVAEAYGWGDDWRAGLASTGSGQGLTDDEILARLFRLNQERAG